MIRFDIIESPLKGTNLIEASAGTGKTYTLAGLFLRLILDKKLMIDDILAVTYTEAATEELRLRIRARLREAFIALTRNNVSTNGDELLDMLVSRYRDNEGAIKRLRHAILNFDEASIFTIHGFCQRMLLENAFESRALFNTELITEQSELLHEIIDDFWRINFYNASPLFLQYAMKKDSVEDFFKLIGNRSIDPHFEIIPNISRPDILPVEKEIQDSFDQLQTNWPQMKTEVENILLNYEGLNRNRYRAKSIPSMITSMDDYLSIGEPAWKFDKFIKFTSTSISGAVKKGFDAPQHTFFDLCEDFENCYTVMTNIFDRYLLFLKRKFFNYVMHELHLRKKERNIRTFDDLLESMHRALSNGANSELARIVRKKYKAALIDEFQDTDPVQYDIFTTIFSSKESTLYLIGDPKQAIYRFRGADIFAYMKASLNMQSRYTLGTNWRSEPDLIKAVNTIFSSKNNPFVFEGISFNNVEPSSMENRELLSINRKKDSPMNIWFIDRHHADNEDGTINKGAAESLTSRSVAHEISRLIALGRGGDAVIGHCAIVPNDIAVLVRKNKQARIVQDELIALNIPSVIYSSQSIFTSHEAKEIGRVMTAIAELRNEPRIKAALGTDIFGLSGNDLFALIEDDTGWEKRLNRLHEYHDLWAQYGFIRMFRHLMVLENVRKGLLSFPDGERRITNLLHCAEVLHCAESEHKLGMEGLIKWLAENRNIAKESDENQIRLETDEDAVKIVTIHRSKGLEYPVVFCPFAWDSSIIKDNSPFSFHDTNRDNHLTLDLGTSEDENKKAAEMEEL
ncbi:MAG: UvrD-helicase domain-containing protein, partial [bacterium]|nr:UvrD-helicase domain-containing protein [bacterium]